jgi:hypothetical protein
VRARTSLGAALFAGVLACGASAQSPRAPHSSPSPGALVGEYSVAYDGHGELRVEASFDRAGSRFAIEPGAERFVRDFAASPLGRPEWTAGQKIDRFFVAEPCRKRPCRIRYRFALREAAREIDDPDVATEEGVVIEAPPSTWLLAPVNAGAEVRVRFRVSTPAPATFVTGVFRSPSAPDSWEISIRDLLTSPYSAFGPMRRRRLSVGSNAHVELAIAPGELAVTDDDLVSWITDAARAVTIWFGRFPMPEALVLLVPARGRWIGLGKTLSGGGGAIFVRVGERASPAALRSDWVLVHEMTHLAFPSVAREHDWAEEGLATYIEPFARVRAGLLEAEEAWRGLVEGLPNGLPQPGDRGLDHTPTWGRRYWGGALFYLLADVEIRKRTTNALGLEHALRGILAAGGNNAQRWDLGEAFAVADRAVGVTVLRDLHRAMGSSPHPVDLGELWRQLGVVVTEEGVHFDDTAPLASIRRAITTGTTGS